MIDRKTFGATLWRYRELLVIILPPLLLLPLPLLVPGQESQCAYIMLIMGIYWCTEALPLSVTGMIPIFVMPMLGILKSADVAVLYMQESSLMFFGGLMVAIALEKCNLHKRIALAVLVVMGVKPIWLMFGFMFPTWFLSMWISNTATTSMMIPILEAVLVKLGNAMKNKKRSQNSRLIPPGDKSMAPDGNTDEVGMNESDQNKDTLSFSERKTSITGKNIITGMDENVLYLKGSNSDSEDDWDSEDVKKNDDQDLEFVKLSKGMTLAVAYAANIGGTGTLTGSPPNIILKDFADDLWMEKMGTESPVNFSSWLVYGVPSSIITIFIVWLWLAIFFLGRRGFREGCKKRDSAYGDDEINADIKKEFQALGKISYAEWLVLAIFSVMILLWFFRSPGFVTGWADKLRPGYIKDSVASIMCTVALFVIPMNPLKWGSEKKYGKVKKLLDWQIIHERFPWGLVFLVGGGFSLAEAAVKSGLSEVIGKALTIFDVLPNWLMVTIIALITAMLTEVTSNTATCTLLMPIVANMAIKLGLNPLYLMFPTAVATSYAFLLPVSTPPNAIAFSYGRITVLDMVKTGAVLKLAVLILTLGNETWGMAYFKFNVIPWEVNNTAPVIHSTQIPS